MALTKCSECGREISTAAATCPGCGAPVRASLTNGGLLAKHPGPASRQIVKKYDLKPAVVIGTLALAALIGAGTYGTSTRAVSGSSSAAEQQVSSPTAALDRFCGQSQFAALCYGNRNEVNPIVCRADPRDCAQPSLYSWTPDNRPALRKDDPYAQEEESSAAKRYLSLRIQYLLDVYGYGTAVACKVIHRISNADLMAQMLYQGTFGDTPNLTTPFGGIVMGDQSNLRVDIGTALNNGAQDGAVSGCRYWHDNPQEVERMRQTEIAAFNWATIR